MRNRDRSTSFVLKPMVLAIQIACTAAVLISSTTAIANQSQSLRYHIAAGDLAQALNQFAIQADVAISSHAQSLNGLRTQGLNGHYTVEQALAALLQGTAFQAQKTANGYVVVAKSNPVSTEALSTIASSETIAQGFVADQEVVQLPTINITAENGPRALPQAYAGGQVARGARVGVLGEKDFMETPFSIVGYTSEYVQDSQAKDITGIITKTDPAVYSSGAAGGINESYSIRGFNVSANDIGLNGLYGLAPYYRLTPEFAERVEVLKGPSAMLNGMPPGGSVGGTINVVTKRAQDTPSKRLTTTYDSDAKFGVHADLATRFGDEQQFGLRFNGVYRDGDTAVKNQSATSKFASLGFDWRFERGSLAADLYHSEDHVEGLNRGVGLATGLAIPKAPKATTVFAPPSTFTTTQDDAIILRGDLEISDQISTYASYGHSKTDFNSLAGSNNKIINAQGDFENNFSYQRFQLDKDSADVGVKFSFNTLGIQHDLIANSTWYEHEQKLGFNRNVLKTPFITNIYAPNWDGLILDKAATKPDIIKSSAVKNVSYGLTDSMSMLDDRLNIIVGVRQQEVTQYSFDAKTVARKTSYRQDATTPAFAILYKTSDQVSVYANYIEGLSAGSTAPADAANAGAVFAPYQTKQYEMGAKLEWADFANTFSIFQIEKPSALTDPATNIYSADGEQRNRGVEWGFFGKLLPELKLMGGISYTQAKLTKTAGGKNQGNFATSVPKSQAKLAAEYDLPMLEGLSINANVSAMSKQYANAENSLSVAGRTLYGIGGRYNTQIGQVPTIIRADIFNLSNKAYWASSTSSGLGTPRTLMLSASFDF